MPCFVLIVVRAFASSTSRLPILSHSAVKHTKLELAHCQPTYFDVHTDHLCSHRGFTAKNNPYALTPCFVCIPCARCVTSRIPCGRDQVFLECSMSTWRLGERESCVSVLKSYFQVMVDLLSTTLVPSSLSFVGACSEVSSARRRPVFDTAGVSTAVALR